jgi:hypothetical protein
MYDISIFMPSIRTNKLVEWYKTLTKSCKKYKFQAVIVGPFDLPSELNSCSNVKYLKSYSHPSKSAQLAASISDGELIYHTTDDVHFYEDAIDTCVDYFKSDLNINDVLLMRYIEGENHSNKTSYDTSYWSMRSFVHNHGINLVIPEKWLFNAQFLMHRNNFINYGGFDCEYEYLTHSSADLLLRMQLSGTEVYNSPVDVTNADWYPGLSVDHAPIHHAQISHDTPLFVKNWSNGNIQTTIDFFNYLDYPEIWSRRFDVDSLPEKYSY